MAASTREVCVTCLSFSVFEVPDTFKVKETDKERIRNMENEIEKGRGELSRRQNQEKAKRGVEEIGHSENRSKVIEQSRGGKSKSLGLRGTSPSIIVN